MAGKWDSNLKRLVQVSPQEFLRWLFPEKNAQLIGEDLGTELNRDIRIDLLYRVLVDGHEELAHIEFQRYEDENMSWRVLEYNVYETCKHKCPVNTFVIYLRPEGKIEDSPLVVARSDGKEIWRFHFENVKMWETPTDTLRQMKCVGLLPLLPLTQQGRHPDVLAEALAGIKNARIAREQKATLLTVTLQLATLSFRTPAEKRFIKEQFKMYQDFIKETDLYQFILEEGVEKGLSQGREEGVEAFHQLILDDVCERFPELTALALERVDAVHDLEILKKLVRAMTSAGSVEQARALFEDLQQKQEH